MIAHNPETGAVSTSRATLPELIDLVREVDTALIELHGSRIARLGVDRSGLFSHYAALVAGGAILRHDQIEAFRLAREVLPAYDGYVVLRAGLGELAFLLERAGLRVIACEPNIARNDALKAGLEVLVSSLPERRRAFRVDPGFLPGRIDRRPSLAIATDFAFDLPLESDDAFRRSLLEFDGLLFNPRLFIRVRESPSEQRSAIGFLRALGFVEAAEFPDAELIYLERRPEARRQAQHNQASPGIEATSQGGAGDAAFTAILERLMSHVPQAPATTSGTTWIERRVRNFDLRSAYGGEE